MKISHFVFLLMTAVNSTSLFAKATAKTAPAVKVAAAKTIYILKTSTLTYAAHHPLHAFKAVSKDAAKGKAICDETKCEMLVAVPVKSFDSENSNRDAHMLEVSKGAEFPMITFRSNFNIKNPSGEIEGTTEFAGQTQPMKIVKIKHNNDMQKPSLTAEAQFQLKDFKIEAPALLGVPMSQDIALSFEASFEKQL